MFFFLLKTCMVTDAWLPPVECVALTIVDDAEGGGVCGGDVGSTCGTESGVVYEVEEIGGCLRGRHGLEGFVVDEVVAGFGCSLSSPKEMRQCLYKFIFVFSDVVFGCWDDGAPLRRDPLYEGMTMPPSPTVKITSRTKNVFLEYLALRKRHHSGMMAQVMLRLAAVALLSRFTDNDSELNVSVSVQ